MNVGFAYLGSDGVMYRVYDCVVQDGVSVAVEPPAADANMRLFQSAEGKRRVYRFPDVEMREPTDMALHRQFAAAEVLPDAVASVREGGA